MLHTTADGKKNRMKNIFDGCSNIDGDWGKAVFEYTSSNSEMLPILDIGVVGTVNKNEYFGLKLGAVCFS